MIITLLYVEGCPHIDLARDRVLEATENTGVAVEMRIQMVDGGSVRDRTLFKGSPTILVNGADPFPARQVSAAAACRLYQTENGVEGAPSVVQLEEVIK